MAVNFSSPELYPWKQESEIASLVCHNRITHRKQKKKNRLVHIILTLRVVPYWTLLFLGVALIKSELTMRSLGSLAFLKTNTYGGPKVSRQFQFHHGNFNFVHGNFNFTTAISTSFTAISISPRQFQFHHGNFNFVHGNFNFVTAISISSRQFQLRSRQFQLRHGNFNFTTAISISFTVISMRVVQGGSLARFTGRKNNESRITDIKISLSRITKIST